VKDLKDGWEIKRLGVYRVKIKNSPIFESIHGSKVEEEVE
jgi:hypothetical protein